MAKHIADSRLKANREKYSTLRWKNRTGEAQSVLFPDPVPRNYLTEFKGILAELIARYRLDMEGIDYHAMALVKKFGDDSPDIIAGEHKLQIKGCERALRVNRFALEEGVADEYVFILYLAPDRCRIYTASKDEIVTWELIKRSKYNQYYERQADTGGATK